MIARNVLRALLLCAAAFSAPLSAADAPMKIGIVGTGNIGGALATHWAKAGHELVISSRHPEELQDLAKSLGPKVRVGTPARRQSSATSSCCPCRTRQRLTSAAIWRASGRARSCSTRAIPIRSATARWPQDARKRGTGVTSKEFLPGVRLVRAFNAISESNLKNDGNRKDGRWAIPLASDDAEALKVAERLVRDAGFDPVVVGGLARAREFDVGTEVYTELLTAKQLREALGLK